ncbi:MAG: hypothetical protein WDM87_10950 [Terracidiphilus sp.]
MALVLRSCVHHKKCPTSKSSSTPERKRWKRLRRILDAIAVLSTLVVVGFIFNIVRNQQLPELLLPNPNTTIAPCLRRPSSSATEKISTPRAAKANANPPTLP